MGTRKDLAWLADRIQKILQCPGDNLREVATAAGFTSKGDLSCLDLAGLRLEGQDFAGMQLGGADCAGADLRRASFAGAELRGASLAHADLRGASFSEAQVEGVDWHGATIDEQTVKRSGWAADQVARLRGLGIVYDVQENDEMTEAHTPGRTERAGDEIPQGVERSDLWQIELAMARVPLFRGLADEELRELAELVSSRRFRSKETVVRQGEAGGELYVILEGHTKVVISDTEGRDAGLDVLGPGEMFGEVTLLDGGPRSATVVALSPCHMLVLDRAPLLSFLEKNPRAAICMLEVTARRLRRLTQRADDIAFLNVSARLARRIAALVEEYGRDDGDGIRLAFRLSQQEIGELVSTTRESANKHIRYWEKQGVLSQRAGYLIVHNLAALQEASVDGAASGARLPSEDGEEVGADAEPSSEQVDPSEEGDEGEGWERP